MNRSIACRRRGEQLPVPLGDDFDGTAGHRESGLVINGIGRKASQMLGLAMPLEVRRSFITFPCPVMMRYRREPTAITLLGHPRAVRGARAVTSWLGNPPGDMRHPSSVQPCSHIQDQPAMLIVATPLGRGGLTDHPKFSTGPARTLLGVSDYEWLVELAAKGMAERDNHPMPKSVTTPEAFYEIMARAALDVIGLQTLLEDLARAEQELKHADEGSNLAVNADNAATLPEEPSDSPEYELNVPPVTRHRPSERRTQYTEPTRARSKESQERSSQGQVRGY